MKLIIVRHGESEANKKGIHQGQVLDTSLSKEGKKQAKIVAGKLKREDIEAIYSSDLKRAFETAEELGKIMQIKVYPDKRLREFSWGKFDKTPEKREELFKEFYKKELAKGISKYEIRPPDGENFWDLINRIKSFLEEIKKYNKTVVVYSHGGAIKVVLNLLEGRDKEKDDFRSFHQENTAINEAILHEGEWKITKVNDFEHVKLTKPNKELYVDQEKIYNQIKEIVSEKIPESVSEAYLFGSTIKKEFGKYVVPFGRHKGSNVDIMVIIKKENIPLKWSYIRQEELWTIYQGDNLKIDRTKHKIDFYVVEKKDKEKALKYLEEAGWSPEKIK